MNTIEIKVGETKRLFNDFEATYQHLNDYNGRQEYMKTINGNRIAKKYEVKDTTGAQNFYYNGSQVNATTGYVIYPRKNEHFMDQR